MRITAALFALILLAAPALAAPTCITRNGDTIRCGVPGAMPVGWKLSPQKLWDREISKPVEKNLDFLAKTICGLLLLLAIIALMPPFDGRRGRDWGRQEGDPPEDDDKQS